MRVSVSRSKNFPRPTSSSNFLSHLASTRETLFFSLLPYSRKVERSSRGHGEKEASLDLIVASTLVSMSCPFRGWIANLKRALFSESFSPPPSARQFARHPVEGVQKKLARKTRFYPHRVSPRRLFILFSEGKVWFMSAGPGGKIIVLVPRNEAGCLFLDDRR